MLPCTRLTSKEVLIRNDEIGCKEVRIRNDEIGCNLLWQLGTEIDDSEKMFTIFVD